MSRPTLTFSMIAVLGLLTLGPAAHAQPAARPHAKQPTPEKVRWFVLMLQDKPSGWAKFVERKANDRILTEQKVHIAMGRVGRTIEVEMRGRFLETEDGRPIEATASQKMGARRKVTQVHFSPKTIKVTHIEGERVRTDEREPFEGPWMTPAAAGRHVAEKLEAGAKEITIRTFDPMAGLSPIESTMKIGKREAIEVFGRTVKATRVVSTTSAAPGLQTVSYIDEDGMPLKMEMSMGFIKLTMLAADEKLAKAQVSPPELLDATLIELDNPIKNPRKLRRASFKLQLQGEGGELPDPAAAGCQRYRRSEDGRSAIVTIDLDKPVKAPGEAPELRHTFAADGKDQAIAKLAAKATADLPDDASPTARAEAMRRAVHAFIDAKTLDVGFATASEVAETGRGDCTEHSVLLAAMLRAADIPSRAASGLIYVDQAIGRRSFFGYHMWTQAWIGGRWVDLDATLGPQSPFDAAHIALGYSDLAEGEDLNDLVDMARVLGRLKITRAPDE